MLAKDLDPPNPISLFLKNLIFEDSRSSSVLLVIVDTNIDLFDLGLKEVSMHQPEDLPIVEEDDVLHPSLPLPIFPPPPFVQTTRLALLIHQLQIQNTCLPLMMSLLLNGMKVFLTCIHGAQLSSKP